MPALLWSLALALGVVGCANAGNGAGSDAAPKIDAPSGAKDSSVTLDTPPPIDAALPADASVAADAAPSDSGLFCTVNGDCTNSGECCITLGGGIGFCGPGIAIGSVCIPN